MIMARELTATLICAATCRMARRCDTKSRRRTAAIPDTMASATSAPDNRKPALTIQPPFASNESTVPEGTSASNTMKPVTRPIQRCAAGRRCNQRVISSRQTGKETSALATWTRNDESHSHSPTCRTGNFSIAKPGSREKSKYSRLVAVISADPASITTRNDRRGRSASERGMPLRRSERAKIGSKLVLRRKTCAGVGRFQPGSSRHLRG